MYIQGGGYKTNSNANYNGTGVIQQSGNNLVLVNFNYRVGALGFLASERVKANGDLNVGLLDQRKLLYWVQTHIAKVRRSYLSFQIPSYMWLIGMQFGGNPEHVVIHGSSAGAGSVAHHLTAYDGRDEGLFVGSVPENPFWPTQRAVGEMEFQFDRFVNETGCTGAEDPLTCLRGLDLTTLQNATAAQLFPGTGGLPLPLLYGLLAASHRRSGISSARSAVQLLSVWQIHPGPSLGWRRHRRGLHLCLQRELPIRCVRLHPN